jgi:hypothetical protein
VTPRRRTLSDIALPPVPAVPPEIPPHPPAPEVPGEAEASETAVESARAPRAERQRRAKASRPSARDLVAPARPVVAREALKVDVPADLALLQRLHRRRLDTGMDIRDQVAIAVDEWLTSEGY